jgi:hypothetical protein
MELGFFLPVVGLDVAKVEYWLTSIESNHIVSHSRGIVILRIKS